MIPYIALIIATYAVARMFQVTIDASEAKGRWQVQFVVWVVATIAILIMTFKIFEISSKAGNMLQMLANPSFRGE
jgi:hypothetical protein